MPSSPASGDSYEIVCPHCKKPFRAELIHGEAARYEGFKCPHCRLFAPLERVDAASRRAARVTVQGTPAGCR